MEVAGQTGWTTAPTDALDSVSVLKDNEDVPGLRDEGGIGVTPKEPRFSSESSMATSFPQEPSSSGVTAIFEKQQTRRTFWTARVPRRSCVTVVKSALKRMKKNGDET